MRNPSDCASPVTPLAVVATTLTKPEPIGAGECQLQSRASPGRFVHSSMADHGPLLFGEKKTSKRAIAPPAAGIHRIAYGAFVCTSSAANGRRMSSRGGVEVALDAIATL